MISYFLKGILINIGLFILNIFPKKGIFRKMHRIIYLRKLSRIDGPAAVVEYARDEFANNKSHINGIENFWSIAKMRLSKFRGLNENTFYLHLKETEFSFNHRNQNLYKIILNMLQNNPLKLS
jgi:hypothetical protein